LNLAQGSTGAIVNNTFLDLAGVLCTATLPGPPVSAVDQVPGVRALDLWRDGRNGAVLSGLQGEADLDGSGEPVLYEVYAERVDGGWRPTTWGQCDE
jgi:hypothetical protein